MIDETGPARRRHDLGQAHGLGQHEEDGVGGVEQLLVLRPAVAGDGRAGVLQPDGARVVAQPHPRGEDVPPVGGRERLRGRPAGLNAPLSLTR